MEEFILSKQDERISPTRSINPQTSDEELEAVVYRGGVDDVSGMLPLMLGAIALLRQLHLDQDARRYCRRRLQKYSLRSRPF